MGKRIYLHIGTHKTGTTAIQVFLATNFAGIPNYLYPKEGRFGKIGAPVGHHKLAHSVLGQIGTLKNADAVWGAVMREIDASVAANVVLSSEVFDEFGPKEISRVGRYLSGHRVTVVVYLRRQDELIQAQYSTRVRTAKTSMSFDEWLNKYRGMWDYYVLLNNWADVFGRENMQVRVYMKERLVGGDAIRDFCELVGIASLDGLQFPEKRLNVGLTRNVIEIMRLMNSLDMPKEWVEDVRKIARRVYPDHRFYDILSPIASKRLMDHYRSSNEKVLREFLDNRYDQLFSDSFDYMTEEEWQRLYGQPHAEIRRTIVHLKHFMMQHRK